MAQMTVQVVTRMVLNMTTMPALSTRLLKMVKLVSCQAILT